MATPAATETDVARWQLHAAAGIARTIDGSGNTAAASIGMARDWRSFRGGRVSVDGSLIGVTGRSGVNRLDRDVQLLAIGLRWRRGGWLLGFSPALATARTDAVSGNLQFLTTVGWQWRCCALLLQHISNAGANGRNLGENLLMLETGFGRN